LLDSARPRAPQLQPSDIHIVIRHSIDLLNAQAAKKQISINSHLQAQNAVIPFDIEQMTQVLLNLILNALQILPDGGQVDISSRQTMDDFVLEIADDGPGIPDDEQARVFDPFFTKREGGVGLGLAVVQQIIAAHGGTIRVGKSKLGGALFTITLPMKETS
jgi:signal transduction histidine kinase